MKKLMIAAAAAMLGIAANAANYTWGFSSDDIKDPATGTWINDGTAFLFVGGNIGQTKNADGTYTLDFTTATFIDTFAHMDTSTYKFGEFDYDAGRADDAITQSAKGVAGQDFSLILINDATIETLDALKDYAGDYFIADGKGVSLNDQATGNPYMEFKYSSAIAANEWRTASAIPEPTSGLLLLLGVAGLALRRRRA